MQSKLTESVEKVQRQMHEMAKKETEITRLKSKVRASNMRIKHMVELMQRQNNQIT